MIQVVTLTQPVTHILCSENYRVSDHTCVICAPGTYNAGGDDASGTDAY